MPQGRGTWRNADQPTICATVRPAASCPLAVRLCCRMPWRHGRIAMLTLAHSNLVASTTARACVCVIARGDDVHVNVAFEKAHRDCFHGNPLSSHHRATLSRWRRRAVVHGRAPCLIASPCPRAGGRLPVAALLYMAGLRCIVTGCYPAAPEPAACGRGLAAGAGRWRFCGLVV